MTAPTPAVADRRRGRFKMALRLVFAGIVCSIGLIALFLLVRTMAAITQSEETAEVFNVAAQLPGDLQGSVEWLPDPLGLPRRMEPLTRDDITDAWLRGWSQIAIMAKTGDSAGLEEYFTNSAQKALLQSRMGWSGLPVHQIGHELELTFYSEDGSVAAFTATQSRVLRRNPTGHSSDDAVWYDAVESYDVVLLLEDGNWRMQHWVRRSADGVWWSEAPAPARAQIRGRVTAIAYLPQDATAATFFAAPLDDAETEPDEDEELDAGDRPPSELAATDPAAETSEQGADEDSHAAEETPPAPLWTFDPDVIEADLRLIRSLGVNAIQIPLNFEALNGRDISSDELDRVELFMDIAATEDVKVIVTLFDGRSDHRVLNWDADEDHLSTVVELLAQHPALLVWDLQHNADETIGVAGVDRDLLYAWLGHMSRALRSIDDVTPTTVTWSTLAAAAEAPDLTDMISVAAPADPAAIDAMVADIRALHPDRPVLLSGATRHTHLSIFPGGQTEKEQAAYVADVLLTQRRLDITGAIIGPLWDLSVPPADAGLLPIGLGARMQAGLLRADATPKPAALAMSPQVDLATVNRPTFADGVRKPFHLILLMLLAGAIGLVVLTRRGVSLRSIPLPRRRRRRARRNKESEELELTAERAEANTDPPDGEMASTIPLISRPLPPSMTAPGAPDRRPPTSDTTGSNGSSPSAGSTGSSSLAIAPPPLIKPAITTEQLDHREPVEDPADDPSNGVARVESTESPDDERSPLPMAPPMLRAPDFDPPRPEVPIEAPQAESPFAEAPPAEEVLAEEAPAEEALAEEAEQPEAAAPEATLVEPTSPVEAPASIDTPEPPSASALTETSEPESTDGSVIPAHIPLPKFTPPRLLPPTMKLPATPDVGAMPIPTLPTPTLSPPTGPAVASPTAAAPLTPPTLSPPGAAPAPVEPAPTAPPPSIFETVPIAVPETPAAPAPVSATTTARNASVAVDTVDLARVNGARDRFGPQFASRAGADLTVLPFVERAVCDALIHYPSINGGYPKINLSIVNGAAIDGPVIADADYKTLRILALESSFPGRPEADPTFTLFSTEPTPSAIAAMKTDAALLVELSASQSSAGLTLIWKPGRPGPPPESTAFLNRVVSTLRTHDWDAEMG